MIRSIERYKYTGRSAYFLFSFLKFNHSYVFSIGILTLWFETDANAMNSAAALPSLRLSLSPVFFLIILLSYTVYVEGDEATGGAVQMVLLLSTAFVVFLARWRRKISWSHMEGGMKRNIQASLSAILILLLIGSLSGSWLLSGIVPTIIYYGLQVVYPPIFLFATCVTCAIVSLITGSSWSTIATIGIAFMGMGKTLGLPEGVVAGAIISGAYFGDKMSPLSDTTNLAAAVAGAPLFVHIRYMLQTTLPSILIALVLFLFLGFYYTSNQADGVDISLLLASLSSRFHINGWLLLVPLCIVWLIARKVSAAPALLLGSLLGILAALIFQPSLVAEVGGNTGMVFRDAFLGSMRALYTTIALSTNDAQLDSLFRSSGMAGMLNTIWLIISAMCFGGAMEASGFLKRITQAIVVGVKSTFSLIATTTGTCIFCNLTASDQYLSIVVSGKMFESIYDKKGLKPEVLSRTLEDGGTVTSVLVPWNTCGATQASILQVSTFTYAPYAFFNLLSPLMTLLFAMINWRIRKKENTKENSAETD